MYLLFSRKCTNFKSFLLYVVQKFRSTLCALFLTKTFCLLFSASHCWLSVHYLLFTVHCPIFFVPKPSPAYFRGQWTVDKNCKFVSRSGRYSSTMFSHKNKTYEPRKTMKKTTTKGSNINSVAKKKEMRSLPKDKYISYEFLFKKTFFNANNTRSSFLSLKNLIQNLFAHCSQNILYLFSPTFLKYFISILFLWNLLIIFSTIS